MYRVILFDLDGTLTESGIGITNSVQYALTKMGCPQVDPKELECFVGPPLKEQFMWFANFREDEAEQAVEYYREYYEPKGAYENTLYPGIGQMLKNLYEKGYILAVASSKPTYFVEKILQHFSVNQYFQVALGSEMDGSRVEKSEVIEETLRRLNCQNHRQDVIMVGDREYDVLGARKAGLDCMAVTYGYGSRQELEAASPVAFAENARDVEQFFVKQSVKKQNPFLKIWRCLYPIGIHWGISGVLATILAGIVFSLGYDMQGYYSLALWITGLTSIAIIPIALLFYYRDQRTRGERVTGKRFTIIQGVWTAVFACVAGYLANLLISISGIINLSPTYMELSEQVFGNQSFITMIICVCILAPIAEELIFRGLVYRRLKDYTNVWVAVIVSSLIFGLYHGNLVQFVYASAVGAIFAFLYEISDNLWIPMIAHMASNFWSSFMDQYGTWLSSGIGSIVFTTILVIMIFISLLGSVYWVKNKNNLGLPHF